MEIEIEIGKQNNYKPIKSKNNKHQKQAKEMWKKIKIKIDFLCFYFLDFYVLVVQVTLYVHTA